MEPDPDLSALRARFAFLDALDEALKRNGAISRSGAFDGFIADYWAQYTKHENDFTEGLLVGQDPLVVFGALDEFETYIREGCESSTTIDEILHDMVLTRSLSGVRACLSAGADPLSHIAFAQNGGENITILESAHNEGVMAIFEIMQEYATSEKATEHRIIRANKGGAQIFAPL